MLAVEELSAEIQGVQVLRNVNLSMPQGSTIALIGRNGAGKTSLLRSIMGFMHVTRGRITMNGTLLDKVPPHHRPVVGIGYAPEDMRIVLSRGHIVLHAPPSPISEAEFAARLSQSVYPVCLDEGLT